LRLHCFVEVGVMLNCPIRHFVLFCLVGVEYSIKNQRSVWFMTYSLMRMGLSAGGTALPSDLVIVRF